MFFHFPKCFQPTRRIHKFTQAHGAFHCRFMWEREDQTLKLYFVSVTSERFSSAVVTNQLCVPSLTWTQVRLGTHGWGWTVVGVQGGEQLSCSSVTPNIFLFVLLLFVLPSITSPAVVAASLIIINWFNISDLCTSAVTSVFTLSVYCIHHLHTRTVAVNSMLIFILIFFFFNCYFIICCLFSSCTAVLPVNFSQGDQ